MEFKKISSSALVLSVLSCGGETITDPMGQTPGSAVASVSIDATTITFGAIGSAVNLTTVVLDSSGNEIVDPSLVWAVLKGGVVTVSPTGRVTSLAGGTDSVRVTAGGSATAFVEVSVTQIPVVLQVATTTIELTVAGAGTSIQASVLDSNFNVVATANIAWTSSDSNIVDISENGTATAIRSGTAQVYATSGSLTRSTNVRVSFTGPHGEGTTGNTIACTGGFAGPFPCDRMEIVSYMPVSALGGSTGIALTDMWGWTDSLTGQDWALVHRVDGMAFVDVTDPSNPRYAGFLAPTAGSNAAVWRDVKVFQNHAFVVGDGSGSYGMQVFDLTGLRNIGIVPQKFSETAHYSGIAASHNITINEETGFAFIVGAHLGGTTCGSGLHMVDIQNPTVPIFAGCFSDSLTGRASTGYTHDAQCILYDGPDPDYQGREICFGLNETALSIADVTDKSNAIAISRASYPGVLYAHQGWLTEDRRYLYSNDELDELQGGAAGTTTMIWDVADLDDPILVKQYVGPTRAIDHNAYVKGELLYQANYQFGIRVLDIADPENPIERASFDTAPNLPDTPGFGGAWTSYPFFDSGVVLVTSGQEGFFILRITN